MIEVAEVIGQRHHLPCILHVVRDVAEPMVLMAAPLVPHIAEELWRRSGRPDTITYVAFPAADSPITHSSVPSSPLRV